MQNSRFHGCNHFSFLRAIDILHYRWYWKWIWAKQVQNRWLHWLSSIFFSIFANPAFINLPLFSNLNSLKMIGACRAIIISVQKQSIKIWTRFMNFPHETRLNLIIIKIDGTWISIKSPNDNIYSLTIRPMNPVRINAWESWEWKWMKTTMRNGTWARVCEWAVDWVLCALSTVNVQGVKNLKTWCYFVMR